VIRTRLGRGTSLPIRLGWQAVGLFLKRPATGAETLVFLASAPEAGEISGGYFVDSRERSPSARAQDDDLGERLWAESERLAGL
jgi:hypothetical protein